MNLHSHIILSDGRTMEFDQPFGPILAVREELPLAGIRLPRSGAAKGPPQVFPPGGAALEVDARLLGTLFLRARLPAPGNCSWRRTIIFQKGALCAVFDQFRSPEELGVRRVDAWDDTSEAWKAQALSPSETPQQSGDSIQILSAPGRMGKFKLSLVEDRWLRLAGFQEGILAGLADPDRLSKVRNINLRAEAFWLDQSGFALLNGRELRYSGRPLLEAPRTVSIEFDFESGMGAAEAYGEGHLILHGGNVPHEVSLSGGRTEFDIVGMSRKSDWWNVVMGAVQKL
jgi:hypothetical protein